MSEYSTALQATAQNLGMNPQDLDLYVYIESSRNPKWLTQKNSSGYGGILQWGDLAAQDLGYRNTNHLLAQNPTFTKQFQVAEKWIRLLWSRHRKKSTEAAYLYLCHFLPYNAKKWGQWDAVLQGKTKKGKVFDIEKGTATYKANSGLDYDKDGRITVGDIRNIVALKAKEIGMSPRQNDTPNPQSNNDIEPTGEDSSDLDSGKIIGGLTITVGLIILVKYFT